MFWIDGSEHLIRGISIVGALLSCFVTAVAQSQDFEFRQLPTGDSGSCIQGTIP
jgi:hypothetical protein